MNKSETSMSMSISEADISDVAKGYYPYKFEATIELTQIEPNSLQYVLKVKNTGDTPLPISPGLHPYWSIDQKSKRNLKVDNLLDFNASTIDWDHAPPDTDFAFNNPTTFHTDTYSMVIKDMLTQSDKIKQLTIWSQPLSSPDHDFVCIEPICGIRGGYISDPVQISPNKQWEMSVRFGVQIK